MPQFPCLSDGVTMLQFAFVKTFEVLGKWVLGEEQVLNPTASHSVITAAYVPSCCYNALRTKDHQNLSCLFFFFFQPG